MPTPQYTALANITLGASAASVTFSSISQAYRDLVLVVTGTVATTGYGTNACVRPNSDSASNYSFVEAWGSGATTYSATSTATSIGGAGSGGGSNMSTTDRAIFTFNLMDYSATDKHKTCLVRTDSANVQTGMATYRWASTSAINSLQVLAIGGYGNGSFAAGSTFALYGVK